MLKILVTVLSPKTDFPILFYILCFIGRDLSAAGLGSDFEALDSGLLI